MLLDQIASIWRKIPPASGPVGQYEDTEVFTDIWCSIVPISRLDAPIPFSHESTHIIWVPYWLTLRKEDQVRYGARSPHVQGIDAEAHPWVYTISGRVRYPSGIPQTIYYARELD